jgi:phage FluMu protein Com
MGDRYTFDAKCAYCGKVEKEVWYAPTCNRDCFSCSKCKKLNFITANFGTRKIKDVKSEDIAEGFGMASNVAWPDGKIEEMAKERLKELKKE